MRLGTVGYGPVTYLTSYVFQSKIWTLAQQPYETRDSRVRVCCIPHFLCFSVKELNTGSHTFMRLASVGQGSVTYRTFFLNMILSQRTEHRVQKHYETSDSRVRAYYIPQFFMLFSQRAEYWVPQHYETSESRAKVCHIPHFFYVFQSKIWKLGPTALWD